MDGLTDLEEILLKIWKESDPNVLRGEAVMNSHVHNSAIQKLNIIAKSLGLHATLKEAQSAAETASEVASLFAAKFGLTLSWDGFLSKCLTFV